MLLTLILSASALDYSAYGRVLSTYVRGGQVDYTALKAHPEELQHFLSDLATVDLATLNPGQQEALYINAYNAFTLSLIVQNYPIASIRDLDGGNPWGVRRFDFANGTITLDQIENKHLRLLGDPRVHAAINCASISCPPLQGAPFLAETLDAQLEAAARDWVRGFTLSGGVLTGSRIFDWYGDDFRKGYGAPDIAGVDGKVEAALNFVAHYWPEQAGALQGGGVKLAYGEYDWGLNRR